MSDETTQENDTTTMSIRNVKIDDVRKLKILSANLGTHIGDVLNTLVKEYEEKNGSLG